MLLYSEIKIVFKNTEIPYKTYNGRKKSSTKKSMLLKSQANSDIMVCALHTLTHYTNNAFESV